MVTFQAEVAVALVMMCVAGITAADFSRDNPEDSLDDSFVPAGWPREYRWTKKGSVRRPKVVLCERPSAEWLDAVLEDLEPDLKNVPFPVKIEHAVHMVGALAWSIYLVHEHPRRPPSVFKDAIVVLRQDGVPGDLLCHVVAGNHWHVGINLPGFVGLAYLKHPASQDLDAVVSFVQGSSFGPNTLYEGIEVIRVGFFDRAMLERADKMWNDRAAWRRKMEEYMRGMGRNRD